MVTVKIHKIFKGSFQTIFLGIEVPWGAWLHFDCKRTDASHIGILLSDHPLEADGLLNIRHFFKGDTEGEEKVTEPDWKKNTPYGSFLFARSRRQERGRSEIWVQERFL
jgi:hypothetical protein